MKKWALILILTNALVAGAVWGQVPAKNRHGLGYTPPLQAATWSASNKPYKEIEDQIANEFNSGKKPEEIAQKYKALALSHPKDPLAQFAWVFAERGAVIITQPGGLVPYTLVEALAKSDPGNVFEYTRYRFCMTEEAGKTLPVQNIKAIGDKLLRHDPSDNSVRLNLIYALCDAGEPNMALPYALQWTKQEPSDAKAHSSLALVYEDIWFKTKKRSDADKAVAEYQQYLRFAPPNAGFRPRAEHLIETIRNQSMSQR